MCNTERHRCGQRRVRERMHRVRRSAHGCSPLCIPPSFVPYSSLLPWSLSVSLFLPPSPLFLLRLSLHPSCFPFPFGSPPSITPTLFSSLSSPTYGSPIFLSLLLSVLPPPALHLFPRFHLPIGASLSVSSSTRARVTFSHGRS